MSARPQRTFLDELNLHSHGPLTLYHYDWAWRCACGHRWCVEDMRQIS